MGWLSHPSRRPGQEGQGLVEFAMVLPVFVLAVFGLFDVGRLVYVNSTLSQAAREGARLAATEAAWIGLAENGCVADESAIGSGNPGAHVCPVSHSAFDAHIASAVNRMAVSVGPLAAVHVSCNEGSVSDPAPSGAWNDAPGGGGNGCKDGAGRSQRHHRRPRIGARRVHLFAHDASHQLDPRGDRTLRLGQHGHPLGDPHVIA